MTTHLEKKANELLVIRSNVCLLDGKKAIIEYMLLDGIHNRSFGPLNSITNIENNSLEYKHID
jgi:hypothetical protein